MQNQILMRQIMITYATKSSFDVKSRNQGWRFFWSFNGTFWICLCCNSLGGYFTRASNVKSAWLGCKSYGICENGTTYWRLSQEIFSGNVHCCGGGWHSHLAGVTVFYYLLDLLLDFVCLVAILGEDKARSSHHWIIIWLNLD